MPEPVFRAKRAEILRAFLTREPLFSTPALTARFEVAAKTNLEAAGTPLA